MIRFFRAIGDLVYNIVLWLFRTVNAFFVGIAKQIEAVTKYFKK